MSEPTPVVEVSLTEFIAGLIAPISTRLDGIDKRLETWSKGCFDKHGQIDKELRELRAADARRNGKESSKKEHRDYTQYAFHMLLFVIYLGTVLWMHARA